VTSSAPANPFDYLQPVAPADFLGRWPVVRSIALDVLGPSRYSHAIIAGRRVGKTSLLQALEAHLRASSSVDYGHSAVVVRMTVAALRLATEADFFAGVLERLRAQVAARANRGARGPARSGPPLDDGLLDRHAARLITDRSLIPFEAAVEHIFERLSYVHGPTRLVLLLDEMDAVLDRGCHELLLGQLRAMVSDGDIADGVRLVVAGSRRFLDDVSRPGSPFLNVLKLHYLSAFEEPVITELSARCEGLADGVRQEIWRQTGGHPFLAQYLLHHLWQAGCEHATPEAVSHLVGDFLHDMAPTLGGWAKALGSSGLAAYDRIVKRADWIDEDTLIEELGPGSGAVGGDLAALCYHGFIVQGDHWRRYRCAGELLQQWHQREGRHLLARWAAEAAKLAQKEIGMDERIRISHVTGSIVNINSELERVAQTVGGLPTADESQKQELSRLVAELRAAVQEVPAERTADAGRLVQRVDALIQEVAKDEPAGVVVNAHASDLTKIASVFQSVVPDIVRIAGSIVALVTGLGW
jgi:hypothetical protein